MDRTSCSLEFCDYPIFAKGYCNAHYVRQRTGMPMVPIKRKSRGGQSRYVYKRVNGVFGMEHRFVMAEVMGRPLLPHENVHHINGDRRDNRPENLELWSSSQPKGQRISDKVAWAKELLALYDPSALV